MATLLYFLLSIGLTVFGLFMFDLLVLDMMILLWTLLFFLGSMVVIFIGFLLFLFFYGLTLRKIDATNMRNHRIINSILRLAFRLMRVNLVVTGEEHIPDKNEKFVFVCNHQENYDIMAIKPIFKDHPLNFIAKAEVFDWFVLGHWIKMLGNVSITREADRSAAESIVKGIRLVKSGIPMAIFPEGKRTFGNAMTDFKPGAFKLAMKPKVDILVGTIYNFSNVFKWWPLKRSTIYLHFHPILKYETYETLNSIELSKKVKQMIQDKLDYYAENLSE